MLIKFIIATIKPTFIIPKNGIKNITKTKTLSAEPNKSIPYKTPALLEIFSTLIFDATENCKPTKTAIKIAAALTLSYSDAKNERKAQIAWGKGKLNKLLTGR
ncbi:MAG: hypothetical protein QXO70_01580 [Candidatus Pacearchaeota archaeon]